MDSEITESHFWSKNVIGFCWPSYTGPGQVRSGVTHSAPNVGLVG